MNSVKGLRIYQDDDLWCVEVEMGISYETKTIRLFASDFNKDEALTEMYEKIESIGQQCLAGLRQLALRQASK